MAQESKIEFQQRWVETAVADVRSAKRRFLIWFCLLVAMLPVSIFFPWILRMTGWIKAGGSLMVILYPLVGLKAGIWGAKLGDAKKFLRECRQDLATYRHPIA